MPLLPASRRSPRREPIFRKRRILLLLLVLATRQATPNRTGIPAWRKSWAAGRRSTSSTPNSPPASPLPSSAAKPPGKPACCGRRR